jgi:signal-transduction protein with cAMP-binding, CBS, and nucleotidyltransferase domain
LGERRPRDLQMGARMDNLCESEFADEYQDWLWGHPGAMRAPWFEIQLGQLSCKSALMVSPNTSLRSAIARMNEAQRGAVLVVLERRLLGIFTERDVLRRVIPHGLDLDDTSVGSLMTEAPEALPETATLAQALRMMVRSRYRHLPVLDPLGYPVGLVSMRRIIEFVSETFPKEILNAPPERQSAVPPLDGA